MVIGARQGRAAVEGDEVTRVQLHVARPRTAGASRVGADVARAGIRERFALDHLTDLTTDLDDLLLRLLQGLAGWRQLLAQALLDIAQDTLNASLALRVALGLLLLGGHRGFSFPSLPIASPPPPESRLADTTSPRLPS